MQRILSSFALVTALGVPPSAAFSQYADDRLCADQNGDGLLTPADFNGWILNYNARSPDADLNQDGVITPADFNGWILAYNQGTDGPVCDTTLDSGFELLGRISFLGDSDTFLIQAGAGDDIRVAVAEAGGATALYPYFAVYAPNGNALIADWDSFGTWSVAANVPQTGTYTIVVRDYFDDAIGDYRLTAVVPDATPDVNTVPLPSGTTLTATLGNGDIDTYSIQADAGDDIRVAVAEAGGATALYPYFAVYAPNGDALLANWDSFGTWSVASNVPQTGTYTIVVNDYFGDATGDYSITAVVPDETADVGSVALSSGSSIVAAIGAADIDTYTVSAGIGSDITVSISETGGSTALYPYIALYAPNGDAVTADWGPSAASFTATNVQQAGAYTIVVQDYFGDATGAYELSVSVAP